jgi:hypothetical protein
VSPSRSLVNSLANSCRRDRCYLWIVIHAVYFGTRHNFITFFLQRAFLSIILRLVFEPILDKVWNRSMMNPLDIDPLLTTFINTGFEHPANGLREVSSLARTIVTMAVCLISENNLPLVFESLIYSSGTCVTFLRENWQNVCRLRHIVCSRCLKGRSWLLKRLLACFLIHRRV